MQRQQETIGDERPLKCQFVIIQAYASILLTLTKLVCFPLSDYKRLSWRYIQANHRGSVMLLHKTNYCINTVKTSCTDASYKLRNTDQNELYSSRTIYSAEYWQDLIMWKRVIKSFPFYYVDTNFMKSLNNINPPTHNGSACVCHHWNHTSLQS